MATIRGVPALHGIDVSHNNLLNNGPIDWQAVASTTPDLQFVMARMTHGGRSNSNLRTDRQAEHNKVGMRAAFPTAARGFYHFLGNSTPGVQAAYFRQVTGPLQAGEFLMLDVEPDDAAGVGLLPIEHIVATLEAIEVAFGLTPMLYIGLPYPGHDDPRLFRFPLVFPAYTSESKYRSYVARMGRPAVIWQWGGADIAGITGPVDADRIEDQAAFHAALFGAGAPEHIETITPAPAPAPIEEDDMPTIITNAEPYTIDGKAVDPGWVKWMLRDDGTKVHIVEGYWVAIGSPAGVALPTNHIDAIPNYSTVLAEPGEYLTVGAPPEYAITITGMATPITSA